MGENFRFSKLSPRHKKLFIIHQVLLFISIALMIFIAVKVTNPVLIERTEKMSVTLGAMVGILVMALAFFNRLKGLMKIKFVAFLIIWILLMCLDQIMDTMKWTIGLALIPLAIDDLILLPIWRNVWYNNYDR